jgi:hypothetical protein
MRIIQPFLLTLFAGFFILLFFTLCHDQFIQPYGVQTNVVSSSVTIVTSTSDLTFTFSYNTEPSASSETSISAMESLSSSSSSRTAIFITPNNPITPVTKVEINQNSSNWAQIELQWENPWTIQFGGVEIRYSTTGYPVDETDGFLLATIPAEYTPNNRYTQAGLQVNKEYFYAIIAYDTSGSYTTPVHKKSGFFDYQSPGSIQNLVVFEDQGAIQLNWEDPLDEDYDHVMVRYSTTDYPKNPSEGYWLYESLKTETSDHQVQHKYRDQYRDEPNYMPPGATTSPASLDLFNGLRYFYTIFCYDRAGNWSAAGKTFGHPLFDPVTDLLAQGWDGKVKLTWTNPNMAANEPNDRWGGVKIVVNDDHAPTTLTDGTLVFTSSYDSENMALVGGLTNGFAYYFTVFGFDYFYTDSLSVAATVMGSPSSANTFYSEDFESLAVGAGPPGWSNDDENMGDGYKDYWGVVHDVTPESFVYRGNRALWCNKITDNPSRASPPYWYNNYVTARMSRIFNLSGRSPVFIGFHARLNIAPGDYFQVLVDNGGGAISKFYVGDGYSYDNDRWIHVVIDCTAELGNQASAKIDFLFATNASSVGRGAFIDNIEIWAQ